MSSKDTLNNQNTLTPSLSSPPKLPNLSNYVTVFNAQRTNDKNAWSPYYDKTFVFKTYKIDTYDNAKMFEILVSYWVLNIPLEKLDEPIRTYRRKENLEIFLGEKLTYFVLDIDKIRSKEDQNKIIEYFSYYKCILGESKSCDNKINFNLKGILFIDPIDIKDAKVAIANLNQDLKHLCDIDEAVCRIASLNAPIGKNKIVLNKDRYLYECKFEKIHQKIVDGYISIEKKKQKIDLDDISGDTIESYCLNVFKQMQFSPMKKLGDSIQFKHPSEVKSKGGYFWFSTSPYTMHHYNSSKTINIYDAVRKTEQGKKLLNIGLDYDDALLNYNTNTTVISTHEKYLKVDSKKEEAIKKFLENKDGLFSIKSPMGTAKSTIIKKIIEEAHHIDMSIIIITNRISVATDFAKKYKMKIYNKDMYNIGDSIIVQFDSLWKYDIHKFDLVIMDEFISLMCHSRNLLGNSSLNIAKFFGAFNKKLVIADAFLTGYENFLLDHKTSNVFLLDNEYRDKSTLFSYDNRNYFFQKLLDYAKRSKSLDSKITVSGTSLNFLRSTKALLEKHGFKCVLLTASTPSSTKELIYGLFEKDTHDKWDVFLYSPSLTVGVSNLNNNLAHFHYDTSMSTDVISSIQMIKRSRKAKEIHMYVAERINYLKITYNSIRDEYLHNIGKNTEQNFLFDVDDYGSQRLSNIGKKAIKIDTFKNILEFNHKKAMFWMMKYHFFNDVREISTKFEGNILTRYTKQIKDNKAAELEQHIKDFLNLTDSDHMDLLMRGDIKESETILKVLAEMNDALKFDTPTPIREEILKICIKDSAFIDKCKKYRVMIDYSQKFISTEFLKKIIADKMMRNEDTYFENILIRYGQETIKPYYTGHVDKILKRILTEVGYKVQRKQDTKFIKASNYMCEAEKMEHLDKNQKVLKYNKDVKEYYSYIR